MSNFQPVVFLRALGHNELRKDTLQLIGETIFCVLMILLISFSPAKYSNTMIMLGAIISAILNALIAGMIFFPEMPRSMMEGIAIFCYFGFNASILIPFAVIWSRFSKYFVNGLETTGATMLFGLYDFSVVSSYWISEGLLDYFGISPGYTSRMKGFLIVYYAIGVVVVMLGAVMLMPLPKYFNNSFTAATALN